MSDGPPSAAPGAPLDAEAIATRVKSALAEALSRSRSPVQILVKVARDHIDVRILPTQTLPAAPGRSFADWFRGRLHHRALTQEGVARMLGVSAKTVGRWAKGDTEPRFRELVLLYETLGESPFVPDPVPVSAP